MAWPGRDLFLPGNLDLGHNLIEQIPVELGNLTPKKLQSVRLAGNPLADPRIRRFVEDDSPTLVKDLLNHVKKHGFKESAAGGGEIEIPAYEAMRKDGRLADHMLSILMEGV